MKTDIAVGLDVGTTKVCAVAARLHPTGVKILGAGTAPSTGIRKGIVINIEATVDAIRNAVREAESASGIKIRSVSAGISGAHVKGFDSNGVVGVARDEVKRADIERAIDSARAVYIPLDREVLHVIPSEFVLDGQEGIIDPAGMAGIRLEARVHVVTAAASPLQNLVKCCERAGLEVADIVFQPLASGHSTLTPDEKESGAIVVDIGGGTTDIALFREGRLRHASALGVGGNHLTSDIAVGLRVTLAEAERLKKESGAAFLGGAGSDQELRVMQPGDQQRDLPAKYLIEIMQPRCEELMELIRAEIEGFSGYEAAPCGVVLTGGSAQLRGLDRLSEAVLGLPVRIGKPWLPGLQGNESSPALASAVGLVTYDYTPADGHPTAGPGTLNGFFNGMKDRIRNAFKYADYLNLSTRKEGGILCLKSKR